MALLLSPTQSSRAAYVTWPSGHKVQYNTHAEKHVEFADIRACLEQKGPYQTWANQKTGEWYFPCQLPNGKWGTLIAKKASGVYQEMSTYIKEPGTWSRYLQWMHDWGATRFTGPP